MTTKGRALKRLKTVHSAFGALKTGVRMEKRPNINHLQSHSLKEKVVLLSRLVAHKNQSQRTEH